MYRDPACYTYSLNHVVLVVGYLIAGTDRDAPGLAPPFWVIRNSWGTDWGDGGYMRMGIEGGDGICGINVLPPLFPVVKSKHVCFCRCLPMHYILCSDMVTDPLFCGEQGASRICPSHAHAPPS